MPARKEFVRNFGNVAKPKRTLAGAQACGSEDVIEAAEPLSAEAEFASSRQFPAMAPNFHHKLAVPKAHQNVVERRGLIDLLTSPSAAAVAVLQGPAGHGKTSLLLQVEAARRKQGDLTGWLSFDTGDDDPGRFFDSVREMVHLLGSKGSTPIDPQPIELSQCCSPSDWVIGQLLLLRRPVSIFLDDVHFVSNRTTLGLIESLLTQAHPEIRWYLGTRALPPINLPRLMVTGKAMVVRADELRFSISEMRQFFETNAGGLVSESDLQKIEALTDGWPAALQLYRLSLGSRGVRDSLRNEQSMAFNELADYLGENVLACQEPSIRAFLLGTAHLRRMSTSLCNQVLDRDDSGSILQLLEKNGLFVRRLESSERWFTYHPIFSQFLLEHVSRKGSVPVAVEHRRAAIWFKEHAHFEEAMHHFIAGGEYESAGELFDTWAEILVPDGHMITVERWFDAMPLAEVKKRPTLVVRIIWALTFLRRHRKLEPLLRFLDAAPITAPSVGRPDPLIARSMLSILEDNVAFAAQIIDKVDLHSLPGSRFRSFELSAACNARGYAAMSEGKFDVALACFAHGQSLGIRSGATFSLAYSIAKTALTYLAQGRLRSAIAKLDNAMADKVFCLDGSLSQACLICAHIAVLYEANDLAGALAIFVRFRSLIEEGAIHDYLTIAYSAIARIHQIMGQPSEALVVLNQAESLAEAGAWPRVLRLLACERARIETLSGRPDRAEIILGRISEGGDSSWLRFSEAIENESIGYIRVLIHSDRQDEAIERLKPLLRNAIRDGRIRRQIKLKTLAALAHFQQNQEKLAHRYLAQAIKLAAPDRCMRSIIDEGELVERLLHAHLRSLENSIDPAIGAFVTDLTLAVGGEKAPAASNGSKDKKTTMPLEPLTDKEKKILKMLGNYMSNAQMAQSCFVTTDTIKYHLKNIYSKLTAKNRIEAIRIAHELGFK